MFDSQQVREGEMPFGLDEIFYSRTDPRGVISSCNAVFCRVANYPESKLIGAPHRIVRHPDMPRGVFQLFWDRLQSGRPVGAYVKNRSSDGRHYWVFATARSFGDGYVSVRIKPSSPLFATTRELYRELLAAEAAGRNPQESAAALLAALKGLGFADYDQFMGRAMLLERAGRPGPVSPGEAMLREASDLLERILELEAALLASFESLTLVPTNMRLIAGRLEPSGGPISTVSESYRVVTATARTALHAITGHENSPTAMAAAALSAAAFESGSAALQDELASHSDLPAGELPLFREAAEAARACAATRLEAVAPACSRLARESEAMRRAMLGLDQTRVMGEIEVGRRDEAEAVLGATMRQLEERHASIREQIETLLLQAKTLERLAVRGLER